MSRGRQTFRKTELKRAIEAAREAGAGEIIIRPDGSIAIIPTPVAEPPAKDKVVASSWDDA